MPFAILEEVKNKGMPNGYAGLDSEGKVPSAQLPVSGGAGEANTASNVGTAGVGFFKQKAGVDLQFKKLNSSSSKMTVTDDAPNSEIKIDADANAIVAASSDARLSDARTPVAHTHVKAEVTDFAHAHPQSDVTSLAADLAAKEASANKGTANGYAGLGANSRVPTAQLGGGTADATTFLRGDQTYAVPAGGGGGPATVNLTADLAASTSTTLADATGLFLPVVSGANYYYFKFIILFRTAATTTGIKLGLTYPSPIKFGATVRIPISSDTASGELQGWISSSGDSVTGSGVQAASTDYVAVIEGVIAAPVASGNIQVRFATEVNLSAVTIRQGSCGLLFTL